jgi:hypothetical protein
MMAQIKAIVIALARLPTQQAWPSASGLSFPNLQDHCFFQRIRFALQ